MDGYHWLYNLDQTIIDAPKVSKKKGRKKSAEKLLEDMRSGYKNPPKQVINGHNPCYIPSKDTILMPDISQFLEIDEKHGDLHWLSTGFHEHGHSAGAKTRIYSEEGMECISKGSHNYAKEEFVAEITACMLMGHYGEECRFIMKGKELTDIQSKAYVGGWGKSILGDKKKHLVSAIRTAVKRTAHILGA
jgi:antirestriction protein ArdC